MPVTAAVVFEDGVGGDRRAVQHVISIPPAPGKALTQFPHP